MVEVTADEDSDPVLLVLKRLEEEETPVKGKTEVRPLMQNPIRNPVTKQIGKPGITTSLHSGYEEVFWVGNLSCEDPERVCHHHRAPGTSRLGVLIRHFPRLGLSTSCLGVLVGYCLHWGTSLTPHSGLSCPHWGTSGLGEISLRSYLDNKPPPPYFRRSWRSWLRMRRRSNPEAVAPSVLAGQLRCLRPQRLRPHRRRGAEECVSQPRLQLRNQVLALRLTEPSS